MKQTIRCAWANTALMKKYHDKEWGVPIYDDRKLFEFMLLDAFQAGLSWSIILNKRKHFRKAFDNFNYKKVVKYDNRKIKSLLNNKDIIRNKLKIEAAIINARAFIMIQKEFGSFSKYIWRFTKGSTILNKRKHIKEIPTRTKESDAMSRDLKKRGFKFAGSTICYAFMQASGMVNDHTIDCFRYGEITEMVKEKSNQNNTKLFVTLKKKHTR